VTRGQGGRDRRLGFRKTGECDLSLDRELRILLSRPAAQSGLDQGTGRHSCIQTEHTKSTITTNDGTELTFLHSSSRLDPKGRQN
jgi:hypothetical protein